jgi:enterochelin esterase family protein
MENGRVILERIESAALQANPAGDASVRTVPIYLPPSYDRSGTRRYPVVFVLTGFTGRGRMLLNDNLWAPAIDDRMDALIARGAAGQMILVMPDCATRYGGSQYLNSTATGRYEDHVIEELVPWVDRRYRTLASREHRGVVGKSSGGYGAMVLAMRHPDVFGAVACHSGDMAFEYCYLPDFPKFLRTLAKHDGLLGFLRTFDAAPRKTRELVEAMNILAMAACYSPNPRRKPLGIDLPFDLETGALDAAVWARWLQHDPLRMAPEHLSELRRLRLLFIDCGTRDEFNLQWGARQLAGVLRRHDVPHLHEEFDDGHMDIVYRYDRSLPLLWEALRGS